MSAGYKVQELATADAWIADANCAGVDTNLFFPEMVPTLDGQRVRVMSGRFVPPPMVVEACAGCSVRAECLAYAVANKEPTGYWGGVDMRRYWTDKGDRRGFKLATPKAREYRLTPARRGEVQVEAPCAGTSGRLS
jgi:hypothetical protein